MTEPIRIPVGQPVRLADIQDTSVRLLEWMEGQPTYTFVVEAQRGHPDVRLGWGGHWAATVDLDSLAEAIGMAQRIRDGGFSLPC